MRIALYNENCVQAGKPVSDRELEQAEADNDGLDCDPWEAGDWTIYDAAPEQLLDVAASIETNARPGGGGQYDRRVARNIRQAVYAARPELEARTV